MRSGNVRGISLVRPIFLKSMSRPHLKFVLKETHWDCTKNHAMEQFRILQDFPHLLKFLSIRI